MSVRPPAEAERVGVTVLLFSALRDGVGAESLDWDLPAGADGQALLDALAEAYPAVARLRGVVRLAVNERYAPQDRPLLHGDVVALLTPVSGG